MTSGATDTVLAGIAGAIISAQLSGGRLDGQSIGRSVTDIDTAYAVQGLVGNLARDTTLGGLAGYKIGMSSAAIQDRFGLSEPILGQIFEARLYGPGAEMTAGRNQRIGVECEIAATLAADLGPKGVPYTAHSVAGRVAAIHPAIEILEDRFTRFEDASVWSLAADNMLGMGGVVAEGSANSSRFDNRKGQIAVDGDICASGMSGDLHDGGPMGCLAWLANRLAGSEAYLRAGQTVLCGGITAPHWIVPPADRRSSTILAEVSDLGRASLKLLWE